MKLTANFYLSELTRSQEATRRGIDNTPDAETVKNLKLLAENVLQPVRDKFGPVIISSGYRTFMLNKAIGGSTNSDHCYGYAADFEVPGVDNKVVALWIKENLKFTQLILEFYTGEPDSGWVHCSYNPQLLKNQVLSATRVNGRVKYLPGITA